MVDSLWHTYLHYIIIDSAFVANYYQSGKGERGESRAEKYVFRQGS